MPDWNAIEALASVAALFVQLLLWFLDRRRRANQKATTVIAPSGIVGIVQSLSPLELTLLRRVASLSSEYATLQAKWPANSPMNTSESGEAKGKILSQLTEAELMKFVGVDSATNFRVVCQSLERHRLLEAVTIEPWMPTIVLITELGAAAVRDCFTES